MPAVQPGHSNAFWFISDPHMDPFYDATMDNLAPDGKGPPTWPHKGCRSQTPNGKDETKHVKKAAHNAKWGRNGCDPPIETFRSALAAAAKIDAKPALVVIGGDLPSHNLGSLEFSDRDYISTGVNSTKSMHERGFQLVRQAFDDVPVITTIGNTDTFPCARACVRPCSRASICGSGDRDYNMQCGGEWRDLYLTTFSAHADGGRRGLDRIGG